VTELPQWTEQVIRPVGGQDHLGVGSVVTDRILPPLSPGINVLTPHPRYWSFYAFVVDEYWRSHPSSPSRKDLLRFLGLKESIFSVAGHLCENPLHRASQYPIGSRRVGPLTQEDPKTYEADFPYVKSLGGGYRLYYSTVMQTMGVVRLADPALNLPADAATPEVGKELAEAFRDSIANTKYWKKYFNADTVPASVVREYAEVACLCRLQGDSPDRALLADVFLHGGAPKEAEARRTSLRMMLEIAHQTRTTPIFEEDFRRLLLYRQTPTAGTTRIATFEPPEHLLSVTRRWRLSQLREMFNYALNGMWALIIEWGIDGGGDYAPIPMMRVGDFASSAVFSSITGVNTAPDSAIVDFIDQVRSAGQMTDSLDGKWPLDATLTEDGLLRSLIDGEMDTRERLAVLFTLYVLCLARLWPQGMSSSVPLSDWEPVLEGGSVRVGLDMALRQLRHDCDSGSTIGQSLLRVLTNHVIIQHERVSINKLPEDTFRFRQELDRLRFFPQTPAYSRNDPRFTALSTVCAELNWSGFFADPKHGLSPEGQTIRKHGGLNQYGDQG
jgi:hypothetical protein